MPHRVLLTGTIAARPYAGGNTWAFLQWLLGFLRLGIDTYFVEQIRDSDVIHDGDRRPPTLASSVNARYFREVVAAFDLDGRVALLEADGPGHVGLSHAEIEKLAPDVDLFLNQYGGYTSILPRVRHSVYWDTDPGYIQVWQAGYGVDMRLREHDTYLTVGLDIGRPVCPLPAAGIHWEHTHWPVVLKEWSTTRAPGDTYTTIAEWRSFSALQWQGVWYGPKSDEFLKIIDLPGRVKTPLELCLAISPDDPDLQALEARGWRVASSAARVATPAAYRDYVTGSRGEFTCVKGMCAAGQIAWLGDRSAAYLAAGRPVILQSTGIERHLPTGEGLLTFTDLESAAAAIDHVEADYVRHAEAARALARAYLDSDRVLGRLLELLLPG
jgi:hypothetical protein